jgi:anaerobic selenocysteine-containing dehydrogenase
MLSPMMACEEAYLLGKWIRSVDPQAMLILGPVPTTGQDETFKNPQSGKQTFVIKAEKVPNAAGIRRVIQMLGGPLATWDDLTANTRVDLKKLKGGWVVGGYLSDWQPPTAVLPKGFKVVQDILGSSLADSADVVLPAAAWAEKDGSWENYQGKIQHFNAAVAPIEGARREGDVYYTLLGRTGLYNAADVREEMGGVFAHVKLPDRRAVEPAFEFAEL